MEKASSVFASSWNEVKVVLKGFLSSFSGKKDLLTFVYQHNFSEKDKFNFCQQLKQTGNIKIFFVKLWCGILVKGNVGNAVP